MRIVEYLRSTKFKVNPHLVKQYLEEKVLPDLGFNTPQTISIQTARRWMHHFGFMYKRYQKGIYVDGHERPDVVTYRNEFLEQVAEFEPLMPKWLDKECKMRTLPELHSGQTPHILVTHDESTFQAYDEMRAFWRPDGEQPLRKKGMSAGLHVSDFLTEKIGRLRDDEGEARVIMALGANRDGYWNGEKLLNQVRRAVVIFE